ncbi:hypothetical protein PHMEG_00015769 [Phytophthora megakarya]|uniref:Uncharacterized protein n=1 Tax=Phytophthora megakarya TaxID=4795 RepID=A0A225W2K4_9STRA|nr:hypothetical protein PHMEG_00015769 [Phytophthora megakarya]
MRFHLDEKAPRYRGNVLEIGKAADEELLSFLRKHSITARGAQNVLKFMRKLHKARHPIDNIRQQLQVSRSIVDPAPARTNNIIIFPSITPLKPSKNAICPTKGFKTLYIAASNEHKIHISDKAIRYLRLTMNTIVADAGLLPDSIHVFVTAFAERKNRRAALTDVREWLIEPASAEDEGAEDEYLQDEKRHEVRKMWNWKRLKGTVRPKNLERTLTALSSLPLRRNVVLSFYKKIFEDEAVENNAFNDSEG